MHSHPDHLAYVLNNQKLKFTSPDGQKKEFELKAGQVLWLEAGFHKAENAGKIEGLGFIVELKE